jgi:hypothetical protein
MKLEELENILCDYIKDQIKELREKEQNPMEIPLHVPGPAPRPRIFYLELEEDFQTVKSVDFLPPSESQS